MSVYLFYIYYFIFVFIFCFLLWFIFSFLDKTRFNKFRICKSLYNNTYFIEKRSIFCWYKENKDFITLDECELYLLKNLKYKDKIIIKYV